MQNGPLTNLYFALQSTPTRLGAKWPDVAVFDEEYIDFARVRQNLKFKGAVGRASHGATQGALRRYRGGLTVAETL